MRTREVRPVAGGLHDALCLAVRGCDHALSRWWTDGLGEIERVLLRHGLSHCEVEDAAQCVLIEVWHSVTRGRTVRAELPWLARLIRNVAADVVRNRSRQRQTKRKG